MNLALNKNDSFLGGCGTCPIQKRAVCAYCDDTEKRVLDTLKTYKTYAPGEPIIYAGDPMGFVGTVVEGVARLSQTMKDGRRQMVGLLFPSDFVGRPGRQLATFDVDATTEVTLCRFDRKPFEKTLLEIPHLHKRMLEMALDELDAAREWMLLLGRKTAREKIASLLVIIARRQNITLSDSISMKASFNLSLTREAMSEYLGLTLETVSRQMNALQKDGVIALEKKRRILIKDFARILDETGDDADGGFVA